MSNGKTTSLLFLLLALCGCQRNVDQPKPGADGGCVFVTATNNATYQPLVDVCMAQTGKRPWLIMHHYVMIIEMDDIAPGSIALLPPQTETTRVRRGMAFCNREILQYAQIAPKNRPFSRTYDLPGLHERPFLLHGALSDDDLCSLFDFLWAHELNKDCYAKDYVISVSTKHQERGDLQGTIQVTTERGCVGHTLYLRRGLLGWKIVSFENWIS